MPSVAPLTTLRSAAVYVQRAAQGFAIGTAGLILSSLRRLWPWQETTISAAGAVLRQTNVLPTAWTPEVTAAVVLALSGFLAVIALGSLGRSEPHPSTQVQ